MIISLEYLHVTKVIALMYFMLNITWSSLSLTNKSRPVKLLSCSSRTNRIVGVPHHQQKACYIPFIKMIFNLIC